MRLGNYQIEKLIEIIAMFLINIVVFLLGKIFVKISFGECLLYSIINSIWMPFILLPVIARTLLILRKKEKSYVLEPLYKYISEFEKRQKEIKKEIELERKELENLEKKYRFDWKLFRKFLQRKGINQLYHFTDETNLKSIMDNGGLFSWHYCGQNKITIERPGGDQLSRKLDKRVGLENYVRLSFTPDHPMMYAAISDERIQNPVILEIDIAVIFLKDSKFSNKNATSNNVNIGQSFEDFSKIRFDILTTSDYLNTTVESKPYFQAEVLVEEKIPLKQIINIKKITTYA
ncbi:DarT ssDNA thymidine ADP-ribosyltransferase family protein [Fulvivirgaceae bacterium BMA12]|uniref:DarT ssDNA thymidine ADP-ribosyltransferase family protein n=1 Tax=Agaribacillus aureus TaxID=3051825 RepID=A0ABT8L0H5_9BACT|nr:DarT ssDNA thymidine ADP-ribosyltransferase family protein [Fulvivirgaceae bacterium BMA12]